MGLHITRQCDTTICDVILILASHYIFNKMRHLQVSPRQVKKSIKRDIIFLSNLHQ